MAPTLEPAGPLLGTFPHHAHPVVTLPGHRDHLPQLHLLIPWLSCSGVQVDAHTYAQLQVLQIFPSSTRTPRYGWGLDVSGSVGDSFLCTGPGNCGLGLVVGTQADKSSVLLGWPRELALKPRGLLSLGAGGGRGGISPQSYPRDGTHDRAPPQLCQD